MGRNRKDAPQIRIEICKLVKLGLSVSRAAGKLKVHHKTVAAWRSADPGFDAQIAAAEAVFIQRQVEVIKAAARNGSWQAAAWLLERKHALEFSQPQIQLLHKTVKIEFEDLGKIMEAMRQSPEAMRTLHAMGEAIEVKPSLSEGRAPDVSNASDEFETSLRI